MEVNGIALLPLPLRSLPFSCASCRVTHQADPAECSTQQKTGKKAKSSLIWVPWFVWLLNCTISKAHRRWGGNACRAESPFSDVVPKLGCLKPMMKAKRKNKQCLFHLGIKSLSICHRYTLWCLYNNCNKPKGCNSSLLIHPASLS